MKSFILSVFILSGFLSVTFDSFFKSSNEDQMAEINSAKNVPAGYDCSDGWRITGYFTPIETDYDSLETREIEIKNVGKMSFNADFLGVVFDENKGFGEGWGK